MYWLCQLALAYPRRTSSTVNQLLLRQLSTHLLMNQTASHAITISLIFNNKYGRESTLNCSFFSGYCQFIDMCPKPGFISLSAINSSQKHSSHHLHTYWRGIKFNQTQPYVAQNLDWLVMCANMFFHLIFHIRITKYLFNEIRMK